MSEVKLEPCPFCGSDEAGIAKGRLYSYGQCGRCGATSSAQTTNEKAAKAWNTRTPHPAHAAVEAMAQTLKEMIDERYSELDMMSCEYPRGSAEALAWESGVRQAWKLWDLSKQPGVAALAAYRATQNKDVRP